MAATAAATAVTEIRAACGASAAHVAVAFSGGKDASVLLHLALAAFPPPQCVRAVALERAQSPLGPEWHELIVRTLSHYNRPGAPPRVALSVVRGDSLAAALGAYLREHPTLSHVLMGRRDSDLSPTSSGLPFAELTDGAYPALWRVYPLRHWAYAAVWAHIRAHGVPYCVLYDAGYTSLGANRSDSAPNPALAVGQDAAALADAASERSGR